MADLLIRGALLVDGTGAPARRGDLAVTAGRISAVGDRLDETAAETIDAGGLALAPGIIDGHTHYDAQLTWDAFACPSPALGVTTAVIGNCGFTIAPCRPQDRERTMRNLTHVEGMALEALEAGIRWEFESFPDYMAMLERRGLGLNVAAYFGHSSLRTWVLGPAASERAATDDEIAQMAALVREAMAAGAVGFASSTNEPHNGEGGVPMPSRLADRREFAALLAAMRESGRGLYMLTRGPAPPSPRWNRWRRRRARRSWSPPCFTTAATRTPPSPSSGRWPRRAPAAGRWCRRPPAARWRWSSRWRAPTCSRACRRGGRR